MSKEYRPGEPGRITIEVDISNELASKIQASIVESIGTTERDYINSALTLLDWMIEESRLGRPIASIEFEEFKELKDKKPKTITYLLAPILERVAPPITDNK